MQCKQSGFSHLLIPICIVVVAAVVLVGVRVYKDDSRSKPKTNSQVINLSSTKGVKCQGNVCIIPGSDVEDGTGPLVLLTNPDQNNTSSIATGVKVGQTITSKVFDIKYLGTKYNPTLTGDPADPGSEYVVVNFQVTELPNAEAVNMANALQFSYFTTKSTKNGLQGVYTADGANFVNPITGASESPKNVSIPNEISFNKSFGYVNGSYDTLTPDSNSRGSTESMYLLYEVQDGDKGSVDLTNGIQSFNFEPGN